MPLALCGLMTENKNIRKPSPTRTILEAPPTGRKAAMLCAPNDFCDRNDERRFTLKQAPLVTTRQRFIYNNNFTLKDIEKQ